jgi:hypothetical protein
MVLITGRCYVDGVHMERRHLRQRILTLGGHVAPDKSSAVTVLVHGELWVGPLTDERRRYSQKLVYVEKLMRTTGVHVHVVDDRGLSALVHGDSARCHALIATT